VNLPTLYKKTSTGAIEQWRIEVEPTATPNVWDIVTEYGHVGGKLQTARERVAEGKNLGKKNATTALQQAESQAKSEWETKLTRKGYAQELGKAEAGENEGAGGVRPMLAHKFTDYGEELTYPLHVQPKLDGIRCIAIVGDTGVTLWSREQKPIVAVPHIARAVEKLGLRPGTVLDGELYNHALKADFEKISSCVRKKAEAPPEQAALIQYHVYDLPRGLPPGAGFADRILKLDELLHEASDCIQLVETKIANGYDELTAYMEHCLTRGYEGAMARELAAPYEENKRSHFLQKIKKFDEGEFDVVGVYEGVGKMAGLAIFVCSMEKGHPTLSRAEARALADKDFAGTKLFGCKMEGSLESLRQYLDDDTTWRGKQLTVKYQGLTSKRKVCRFPVGKAVRDYE
jgi:DNA ligase-1